MEPTIASPSPSLPLTPEAVASWRDQGFALVHGVFPDEIINAAKEEMRQTPPGRLGQGLQFPSTSDALNRISTHPRLRAAAAQLLGTSRLTLLQSEAWSKSPPGMLTSATTLLGLNPMTAYSNNDQRMHMDYPNHYLTHPSPWSNPDGVEAILYFDDYETCGGATRAVPRSGDDDEAYSWPYLAMPGTGGHAWLNDKSATEKYFEKAAPEMARFRQRLYEREVELRYRAGTILLYRFDTWHRGSPLRRGAPARRVLNLVVAKEEATWITPWNCRLRLPKAEEEVSEVAILNAGPHHGFSRMMYFGAEEELDRMTVKRKCALGVPPPDADWYWTSEMREAVRTRFPRGDWASFVR